MNIDHLQNITRQFLTEAKDLTFEVIGDGHIHDTYKIYSNEDSMEYILQKITTVSLFNQKSWLPTTPSCTLIFVTILTIPLKFRVFIP